MLDAQNDQNAGNAVLEYATSTRISRRVECESLIERETILDNPFKVGGQYDSKKMAIPN